MRAPTQEEVQAEVKRILDPYLNQQADAMRRIAGLVQLTEHIIDWEIESTAQDILRAAVVLTHAHLEEFLRTMASVLLPEGDEECLNEIPLAGLGGRKQNFPLGKLVRHRGKTVDDLLKASVSEYLQRSNYNSTDEIGNLLKTLGFNTSDHNKEFGAIQEMIERRHQIVHRADRLESANMISLKPIKTDDVWRWHSATDHLMESLKLPLLIRLIKLKSEMITISEPQP